MRRLLTGLAVVFCLPFLLAADTINLVTFTPNPGGASGQAFGSGIWAVGGGDTFVSIGFVASLQPNNVENEQNAQTVTGNPNTWSCTSTNLGSGNTYIFFGRLHYLIGGNPMRPNKVESNRTAATVIT